MGLLESVEIAWGAVRANAVRSLLTMLGIIIGVAAVIAMMAVGDGATVQIARQIATIGSNVIIVFPGSITSGGFRLGAGTALSLTGDDARAIAAECPAVAAAAPVVRGGAQVVFQHNNWATAIVGATPSYLRIRDYSIERGRAFTSQDVSGVTQVALLGETVARNLFGAADPVGHVIRIKDVPFTVLGVLSPKGQSPMGMDQDDLVVIPISTAKIRVLGSSAANAGAVGAILVQGKSPLMKEAQREIEVLLRQRRHLMAGQPDDFTVRNLEDVFSAQENSAHTMSLLLGAIASISLIVGGIGIMNIMLATVLERTREIGTRIAVGARRRDILRQFLVEALTLSLTGGVIGVLLGAAVSVFIADVAHWSILLSWRSMLLAFVFAGLIGVFFGYYPARRAAALNPIDALRYE